MRNSHLKPCPICGSKVEMIGTNNCNPFRVWCEKCGLEFGIEKDYYAHQLYKAWNNRVESECEPKYLGENTAIGCRIGECQCGHHVRSYEKYCSECGLKMNWDNVHG